MRGNDLSNSPARIVMIRLDEFLVHSKKKGGSLLDQFIKLFEDDFYIDEKVEELIGYIFRHTDFAVKYVVMENASPKLLKFASKYWMIANGETIGEMRHISQIDFLLKYGDVTYYVDSDEEIEKVGNKYALTLEQARELFRGRI